MKGVFLVLLCFLATAAFSLDCKIIGLAGNFSHSKKLSDLVITPRIRNLDLSKNEYHTPAPAQKVVPHERKSGVHLPIVGKTEAYELSHEERKPAIRDTVPAPDFFFLPQKDSGTDFSGTRKPLTEQRLTSTEPSHALPPQSLPEKPKESAPPLTENRKPTPPERPRTPASGISRTPEQIAKKETEEKPALPQAFGVQRQNSIATTDTQPTSDFSPRERIKKEQVLDPSKKRIPSRNPINMRTSEAPALARNNLADLEPLKNRFPELPKPFRGEGESQRIVGRDPLRIGNPLEQSREPERELEENRLLSRNRELAIQRSGFERSFSELTTPKSRIPVPAERNIASSRELPQENQERAKNTETESQMNDFKKQLLYFSKSPESASGREDLKAFVDQTNKKISDLTEMIKNKIPTSDKDYNEISLRLAALISAAMKSQSPEAAKAVRELINQLERYQMLSKLSYDLNALKSRQAGGYPIANAAAILSSLKVHPEWMKDAVELIRLQTTAEERVTIIANLKRTSKEKSPPFYWETAFLLANHIYQIDNAGTISKVQFKTNSLVGMRAEGSF